MDYQDMENLFQTQESYPKYKYKRWLKMQDENRGNYNTPVKYSCASITDKLVDYSKGYILMKGIITSTVANTDLAAANKIIIKNGSHSIIHTATVRLNNHEVDKNHHVYLTTTYLNLLEYSSDYLTNTIQYAFTADDRNTVGTSGYSIRRDAVVEGFANHSFNIILKIPLTYLSPFFRRLDWPIINNKLDLELELRPVHCLLRGDTVAASEIRVTNTELYLPMVELPSEQEQKFYKLLGSSYTKKLIWEHMEVFIHNNERGRFDQQIVPSLDGVRKMYVMAVPTDHWQVQTRTETMSEAPLNNINITIDSEDYYSQDVRNDHEAYTLLQECFNMGGMDVNTGSMISFTDFKLRYRLYSFDLSHQKVFESDPRKSQTIRFRCDLGDADHVLIIVLAREKTSEICMNDASRTRTI